MRKRRRTLERALALFVAGSAFVACGGDDGNGDGPTDPIAKGSELFQANCSLCHGTDLRGTQTGPPFLDPIYAPNHHPDEAFFAAVENGVQPHHWDFGPMPPQPAVSEEDVEAIVAYIRSEQEAAGITEDPNH